MMSRKGVAILVSVCLLLLMGMGIAAYVSKARADRYRARVEVLEKAIESLTEEMKQHDREWKAKLSASEKRYAEAEKRRAEAVSNYMNWTPEEIVPPVTVQETIDRLKALGVDGEARR